MQFAGFPVMSPQQQIGGQQQPQYQQQGQPQPMQPPVYQQPAAPPSPLDELPAKARGSRKPVDATRYEHIIKALSACAKAIGGSFTHPATPAAVPNCAPDISEWNSISARLLATIPEYAKLLDDRKTVNKAEKTHNGGLEQHVYLTREMTAFLNTSGVLGPNAFPVDARAGGMGIATRAILTSVFSKLTEDRGLKHPEARKYNMRDAALAQFFTDQIMEAVRTAPPKAPKKKKTEPEAGKPAKKPRAQMPKIAVLQRDGQAVPHFSFDAIPSLTNFYILSIAPRKVTDEQKAQVAAIRSYLHIETEARKARKKATEVAEREAKKQMKVQNSIVPTQVPTLTMNPNFNAPAGAVGLQAFVPQPTQAYIPQQQYQQQVGNTPIGFAPAAGVSFVPQ